MLSKFTYAVRGQKRYLSRFALLEVIFTYGRQWELTATATQLSSFPGGSYLEPDSECFQEGLLGLQLRIALPAPTQPVCLPPSPTTRCGSPRRPGGRPAATDPAAWPAPSPRERPRARRGRGGYRPRPAFLTLPPFRAPPPTEEEAGRRGEGGRCPAAHAPQAVRGVCARCGRPLGRDGLGGRRGGVSGGASRREAGGSGAERRLSDGCGPGAEVARGCRGAGGPSPRGCLRHGAAPSS